MVNFHLHIGNACYSTYLKVTVGIKGNLFRRSVRLRLLVFGIPIYEKVYDSEPLVYNNLSGVITPLSVYLFKPFS